MAARRKVKMLKLPRAITIEEINRRLNEIKQAASDGNQAAVDTLRNRLYRDYIANIANSLWGEKAELVFSAEEIETRKP
jgi:hypothetical protein